jgi:hypothetical protein
MRRIGLLSIPLLLLGCADPVTSPASRSDGLSVMGARGGGGQVYIADHLSGDNEVPPRVTNAQGQAMFKLSADGTELSYRLIVANIENVVAAHIHLGPPTCQCPVVAFLYGNAPPSGGRTQGVLATGVITAEDLVGPLAGQPLSALVAAIEAGNTYVNVHTRDTSLPANQAQAGNFPGGEIRGQIDHGSGMVR